MPKVIFERERVEADVPQGANLREVALANNIPIYSGFATVANCKGNGRCGTCRVSIQGPVKPRNSVEESKLKNVPYLRLACQIQVEGDMTVRTVSDALDLAKGTGFDVQSGPR